MADPGFPVGGMDLLGGRVDPLMWALFGKNVCENKRIGHAPLDPPMLMHSFELAEAP